MVIDTTGTTGILLYEIQKAWGAQRFKVLWDTGEVGDVWDKQIRVICRNTNE